jgi:hypothetical protein
MISRVAVCVLAIAAVGGCTDRGGYQSMLANGGALSIEPSSVPGYEYTVAIKSGRDIGFNPDNKAERDALALSYAAKQCPGGRVVKEDVIDMGSNAMGPLRHYFMRLRCPPA